MLEHLASGSLTLTNARLLAPHLTTGNLDAVIKEAAHKSKHEVEQLIARLRPQPPVPSAVRQLPSKTSSAVLREQTAAREPVPATAPFAAALLTSPAPSSVVRPLSPGRYKVQFTVSSDTREKLRHVQDLMRHTIPDGNLAAIFDRALSVLLGDLEKRRTGAAKRPRSAHPAAQGSRQIPALVRRQVWKRDEGRCAYVGSHGRRADWIWRLVPRRVMAISYSSPRKARSWSDKKRDFRRADDCRCICIRVSILASRLVKSLRRSKGGTGTESARSDWRLIFFCADSGAASSSPL